MLLLLWGFNFRRAWSSPLWVAWVVRALPFLVQVEVGSGFQYRPLVFVISCARSIIVADRGVDGVLILGVLRICDVSEAKLLVWFVLNQTCRHARVFGGNECLDVGRHECSVAGDRVDFSCESCLHPFDFAFHSSDPLVELRLQLFELLLDIVNQSWLVLKLFLHGL